MMNNEQMCLIKDYLVNKTRGEEKKVSRYVSNKDRDQVSKIID